MENVFSQRITSFKKASEQMIRTSNEVYSSYGIKVKARRMARNYTREEINEIISTGSVEKKRQLSRVFFNKGGIYQQIISHYANLLKGAGILLPNPSFGKSLSTSHIKKRYFNAVEFVDKMRIPQLFRTCALDALIDGSYFGIVQHLSKEAFSVLTLPRGYACSNYKDIYGNDLVDFDLRYFNTFADETIKKNVLDAYPEVIVNAYNDFRNSKRQSSIITLPSEIGICLQFFEGAPLFLNIIPNALDYDEAVKLSNERDREEIKKIIVQKMPHLTDGRLVFEPDEAAVMHEGAVGMLKGNENLSVLTTYADVDSIVSRTSADNSAATMKQLLDNTYAIGGTTSQLFGSTGSTTVGFSVKEDLSLMMGFAQVFNIFVTNTINRLFANTNIKFTYKLLPISYFNEDEYVTRTFKLASSGYSYLLPSIACDIGQYELIGLKELENDVLELSEILTPLNSAFTQSSETNDSSPGRPKKAQEEKAEQTIKNEESLDNQ